VVVVVVSTAQAVQTLPSPTEIPPWLVQRSALRRTRPR
jgi:hypothetical protein